ncbi:MAG TPA: NAD(P)-binding domain-containing protein [Stellaceae bacterium]
MPAEKLFHYTRRAVLVAGGAVALAALLRPLGAFAQPDDGAKLRIGVIGSGKIGGTVGRLWVKAGHPVLFSSRHPEELAGLVKELGPLARAGTVEQAIKFGDALLLAIPYGAVPKFGHDYAAAFKGKIILDAANATPARDGAELSAEIEKNGIGVTSRKYLPGALVVRAFNTLNYKILEKEANRPAPRLAIPIAGDDKDAVRLAAHLVADAGFEAVVVGNLDAARKIQRGNPGYGQAVTAAELRQKLGLGH